MKTKAEITELKIDWVRDGCWNIEDTEGFEDHHDELLTWRLEYERQQAHPPISDLELAEAMVAYAYKVRSLAALEEVIKNAVLDRKETIVIAGVRATYNTPRKVYPEWQDLVAKADPLLDPKPFEVTTTVIDWKAAAESLDLKREGTTPANAVASVTLSTKGL